MRFITPYGEKIKASSPAGEKIIYEHEISIDKNGKRVLKRTKAVNIYEKIQESLESTLIENILARYAQGDLGALYKREGSYIDVTDAPKNLAAAMNYMIKAENEFAKLPKEIREKFGNNVEEYIATYGTQDWLNKTGIAQFNANAKASEEVVAKFEEQTEVKKEAISE